MDRIADYNADARPDIFVICHGDDAAPFPGEKDQVVLSRPNGTYVISDATADVGFGHGGAAVGPAGVEARGPVPRHPAQPPTCNTSFPR
jgi:hypothetical protein